MSLIYQFSWQRNGGLAWGHGAEIDYSPDGSVHYRNPRTGPGQAVSTWETANHIGRGPFLPFLRVGGDYILRGDADYQPTGSLGIALTFYDRSGAVIANDLYQDLEVAFTVPTGTVRYKVELISLNNNEFTFRSLMLGTAEDMAGVTVQSDLQGNWLQINRPDAQSSQVLVLVASRETVNALPVTRAATTFYWWTDNATRANQQDLMDFAEQRAEQGLLHVQAAGPDTAPLAELLRSRVNEDGGK